MSGRPTFQDSKYEMEFTTKGYVVVKLLSSQQVTSVLEQFESLMPDDLFDPDGTGIYGNTYHMSFLDTNITYKRKTGEIVRNAISPQLETILNNFQILIPQFFVKQPGKGDLQPHQNWRFVAEPTATALTVWCPLVDVSEQNGTLQVVEGSHRFPNYIAGPWLANYCVNFENEIRNTYSRAIKLSAGEAIIFDDRLLHWSDRNHSDRPRIVMVALCVPAESTPVVHYASNPESATLELFRIDSEFFIEHTLAAFATRPTFLKSLGTIKNRNQFPTEAAFAKWLHSDDRETVEVTPDRSVGKPSSGLNRTLRRLVSAITR